MIINLDSIYQLNDNNSHFIFFNTADDNTVYDWHYDYIKSRNFTINYEFKKFLYSGTISNDHHFLNSYHYDCCINLYNNMLKFDFNLNDFTYKEYIGTEIGDDFSLSYLFPKMNNKKFKIRFFNKYNIFVESNGYYDSLMNFNHYSSIKDSYRNMFIGNKCQSIITNHGDNNGKTLLIIGDSQIIPEVPIFAYYYKNVFYYDNRYNNPIMEYTLYNTKVDQCLVQLWAGAPMNKYKLIKDII